MFDDPCTEETYSLWHFNNDQLDAYWIRCTRTGPHEEHEDENTGLTWPKEEEVSMDKAEINKKIHTHAEIEEYQNKARRLVFEYIKERLEKTDTHVTFAVDEVYVVWFSKTLQNWKAMISTTLPDGMYYEVTYNGDKKETYIDAYKKFDNVCIRDGDVVLPKNVTVSDSRGFQVGNGNSQSNIFG